ncbi:MAG: DUF4434 domain-containing protein [Muribaculaceae bacterium]
MLQKKLSCYICFMLIALCTSVCAFPCPNNSETVDNAAGNALVMPRGSFLQHHLCRNWTDSRWQQEFKAMREAGMDFVILMSTVDTDTAGITRAIYPTAIEGIIHSGNDVLEACLRNAANAGIKVVIGLNFDDRWWQIGSGTPPLWLEHSLMQGNDIAAEIMRNYFPRYANVIQGWYWVWEVEPSFCNNPVILEVLTQALNVNLDFLHGLSPSLPVLLSPFMNQSLGSSDNCAHVWQHILTNAHFADGDIFAPQDCIGSGYLSPDCVEEWFEKLHNIIPEKPAVRFWGNIELFDQRFWTSADIGRVKRQHDAIAPYVDGFISFAYSHYVSPHLKHPVLHRAYSQYASTGEIPAVKAPAAVSDAQYSSGKIFWRGITGNEWLLGYRVRRDGELVADCQLARDGSCVCNIEAPISGCCTITAYDVWGNESEAVAVKVP